MSYYRASQATHTHNTKDQRRLCVRQEVGKLDIKPSGSSSNSSSEHSNSTIDAKAQLRVLPVTEACSSKHQNALVMALSLIFVGLVLRASYVAYLTRKVNIAEINDSREVGLCIYNILLFGSASYLVSFAISSPDAIYMSTALPICLIGTLLVCYDC
jgi:hypothetical protein